MYVCVCMHVCGELQANRDRSEVLTLERHRTVAEKVCIMHVYM